MESLSREYSPVFALHSQASMIDFRGHLSALLFISGCNFRCGFCHNAALLHAEQRGLPWPDLTQTLRQFKSNWVTAATITGGEPTLSPHLPELIEWLKSFDLAVKLDTNGSRPDMLRTVLPRVDYVAMDLKCGLERYPQLTGFAQTDALLESIALIREEAKDYEFRTTVIESIHDQAEIRRIVRLIPGARRYVLQPFVPQDDLPDPAFRALPRTRPIILENLAQIARESLPHVMI